ncbi:MAG: Nif3-like dinuclear metal center hexameric protein [Bacteroidetes bacterium]|nr:Nif3-like dinuclear metal center hexameric protein [Bacteroidota bacterium]MCY4234620.1 Nif3-like dinuclear metal center hexameric protein [Bacteroidota bacterium]
MSNTIVYAHDIACALEAWADPAFAESYDNVGLHVGSATQEINRVLISLDLTPEVLDEAVNSNASMIVTHHPLLFQPPSRIVDEDLIGHLILELAKSQICLYSIHTNLDAAHGGVSFALANLLDLQDIKFLKPNSDGLSGMGAIGNLAQHESFSSFLDRIHSQLNSPVLRYVGLKTTPINTVAVCGGSGGNLIKPALKSGADVFVSADLSYHRFFEVYDSSGHCQLALVDAGHYETEKHTEELLRSWLTERFPSVIFTCTESVTNPIKYSTI